MTKLNSLMLPWPTNWAALFGGDRPLIVEIGFGQGEVLLDLARRYPDRSVIGLEIANQPLTKAERLIKRYRLANLRVIHTMAETALYHLFAPASITQLHINFPDPWFKSKHHHRRLMQRDTLDLMVNRLAPDGSLLLATDIIEYAELADDLLRHTPGLTNRLGQAWATDPLERVTTKYEHKARREGRSCYYFAYQRNHAPAPTVLAVKEYPMPHVVFSSPLTLPEIAAHFEPHHHDDDGLNIHFIDTFVNPRALLVETHVGEPTITQHVALLISVRQRPETDAAHEYTIHLSTVGQPRPTAGIHRAVQLLADWVLALHSENTLIKQKVSG